MWTRACERESEVREAVRRGVDDPALRRHAADCGPCGEAMAVAAWMQTLASTPSPAPSPIDPASLWWKAELLRRWDAERRVAAPMERSEPVQVGIGVLGLVLLLIWTWREAPGLVTALSPVDAWGLSDLGESLTLLIVSGLALMLAVAVVTMRDLFVRE